MNKVGHLVSVVMITYGHEEYIEKSILGILMQEGNYELELIICNDKSPDKTDAVVERILNEHHRSSCISYYKNEENLGIVPNLLKAMGLASGKYIAICEGDDYWTDNKKLQKQFDFLEENDNYSMVCHNALTIYDGIDKEPTLFTPIKEASDISMLTIINKWVIPTASMFFRRKYIDNLPNWVAEIYSGDYTLALLLRHAGKIRFMPENMSVYRVTYSGTSATATYSKKLEFVSAQQKKLLNYFNDTTGNIYSKEITSKIDNIDKELRFYNLRNKSFFYALINMPYTFLKKSINKIFS